MSFLILLQKDQNKIEIQVVIDLKCDKLEYSKNKYMPSLNYYGLQKPQMPYYTKKYMAVPFLLLHKLCLQCRLKVLIYKAPNK